MKFIMTYLILFFMTILLAIPRFLFHSGEAEAGFHSQTEFTIGSSHHKSQTEDISLKLIKVENDFSEPQPELVEWMIYPGEWIAPDTNLLIERKDTAMNEHEKGSDVGTIGFTILNL